MTCFLHNYTLLKPLYKSEICPGWRDLAQNEKLCMHIKPLMLFGALIDTHKLGY